MSVRPVRSAAGREPPDLRPVWRTTDPDRVVVDLEILGAIAASLAFSPTTVGAELPGDGARRYARLLHTTAYDAWLVAWEPASDLDLHDHGVSHGVFRIVRGQLVEVHTDLDQPGPLRTLRLRAGSSRPVTLGRVHRVWNPGPGDALSVHVYSPPLTSMTFYDDSFLTPIRTASVEGVPEPGTGQ